MQLSQFGFVAGRLWTTAKYIWTARAIPNNCVAKYIFPEGNNLKENYCRTSHVIKIQGEVFVGIIFNFTLVDFVKDSMVQQL